MSVLGRAALAMWWRMAPEMRAEFEHWHAHEHFPERLGIPGFLRAARWTAADGGEGIFVMYELRDHDVLSSAPYLERLNAPTPWSTRLMPHHRDMVRSQCHVLESRGGAVARHALTIRLSPAAGQADRLRSALALLAGEAMLAPGIVGMHLLRHEAPAIAATQEQKIRGGDAVADWVLVTCGYDAQALEALSASSLSEQALAETGAAAGTVRALYTLAQAATPPEMA
ncbi:hypothetical protein [Xenophilus sp.]|uniref:hypothetical protein n=1 Tax=Xenophilus sp. TaxID=1873499 RepID=UPI0037DCD703